MRMCVAALLIAVATPAVAQNAAKVAEGAVMTPVEDVNLKKREIPPVLLSAQDDPYSAQSTRNCTQINTALAELDSVLGPDFDSGDPRKTGLTADAVAKGVVASFIPFRGVIREVSGAAGAQRRWDAAVDAGIARRGYLRGVARTKGCRPVMAPVAAKS